MTVEAIVKSIDVPCDTHRAFDVFVNRIGTWWPLDGHAVSAATGQTALDVTIEPRVGGAVFETMHDGTRSDWGTLLAYEPGRMVSMTWHPGTNIDKPTRVDVTFQALSAGQTRVTLTHSGWEVWADSAPDKRGGYDTGWDFVLGACFQGAFKAA